jgi:redox-regulated HSP33 family molecular chaperone
VKPGTRDVREMQDGGVDAGLLLLSLYAEETGRVFSIDEIAYVCGCSHGLVWYVEQEALRKLKKHPRLRAAFSERFG